MARVIRILCMVLLLAVFSFNRINAAGNSNQDNGLKPLEIISITPSGEDVPAGRQITFKFNRPVVPVGRMERDASEIPIEIKPEVKDQWRWIGTSTLALMLDDENALSLATRYEIIVKPGIKTEDGTTLTKPLKHTFITERPKVEWARFRTWESPSMPVIWVNFNQPVLQSSVEKHIFIKGKWKGSSRIKVIAKPDPDQPHTSEILPLPSENQAFKTSSGQSKNKENNKSGISDAEARKIWLISPEKELPLDSKAEFLIEPGLKSANGREKGIENKSIESFSTFPSFTFLGIRCADYKKSHVLIKPGEEKNLCNPEMPISLAFSAPVINREVKGKLTITPDLNIDPIYDDNLSYWEIDSINSIYNSSHRHGYEYNTRIRRAFESNKVYKIFSEQGKISDAFGRSLKDPIDIKFTTGGLLPDYDIPLPVTVLEKDADTDMFLSVTNLGNLELSYDILNTSGKESNINHKIHPPQKKDSIIKVSSQVRKILKGQSGILKGQVKNTVPYVDASLKPEMFFVEVTPFQVHVKIGYFNTLVWVSDMASGNPVSDAKILLYKDKFSNLAVNPEVLSQGITDKEGAAILDGTSKIIPDRDLFYNDREDIFIRVEKDNDIALLPLNDNLSVFSDFTPQGFYTPIHTWGATAQGVYKPGEIVQYKMYIRNRTNESFNIAPKEGYSLIVFDPMNKKIFEEKNIILSDFGAIHGEFPLPESCVTGWYYFEISHPSISEPLYPTKMLVTDFTTASFSVTTDIDKQVFQPGDELHVTTKAFLHDGAPYADASTRVTAFLRKLDFYQFFISNNGQLNYFVFDDPDSYYEDETYYEDESEDGYDYEEKPGQIILSMVVKK